MSLRFKVFLPLLLAILSLTAYIYAIWVPRLLADAEGAYRNSVKRHLESVAEGLVPLMLGRQLDAVYGNLDALGEKNTDWVSIRMLNPEGRQLYPFEASGASKGGAGHDVVTLAQEIRYLDEKLGTLEVGVDFAPRLNEIRKRSTALVYTFLVVLLLILLANGIVLDFIVRKPIRQLAHASQRLADGDFATSLPGAGTDEVGILVNSFSGMRDAVRSHTERLSEANKQLRLEVAERRQAEEALRRMQEELVRREKLAVLGQLSGSVGHELRNPLGVMSNAVYFLKEVQRGGDECVKEYLEIIETEIANSLRIISDLLDFARTAPPQRDSVTAAELVRRSLERCGIPENVTLDVNIPEALPRLRVDPLQMGQVLTNFISNGVQAMPDGGSLHLGARQVSSFEFARIVSSFEFRVSNSNPEPETRNPTLLTPGPETRNPKLDGDFIEISVADSGQGISPENMEKLFQPLFTTKPKGIGLGLVVCKNLVGANGGTIQVESELGKGAVFKMVLPAQRLEA